MATTFQFNDQLKKKKHSCFSRFHPANEHKQSNEFVQLKLTKTFQKLLSTSFEW